MVSARPQNPEFPDRAKLHNVYEDFTESEKSQARKVKQSAQMSDLYNDSELLLAEFGSYYGWQALKDAAQGRMTTRTFLALLEAARKLERTKRLERLDDMSVAIAALFNKKAANRLSKQEKKLKK